MRRTRVCHDTSGPGMDQDFLARAEDRSIGGADVGVADARIAALVGARHGA